jgi:hypothetical protein
MKLRIETAAARGPLSPEPALGVSVTDAKPFRSRSR